MRTIVITLPETPERTDAARAHFEQRPPGDVLEGAYYLDGVHAKTFGLLTCHTYEVDHPGTGYIIPQKHVGLCLSHFIAWQVALAWGEEAVLILEDDAELPEGWRARVRAALASAPADTDLLFVGSGNTFDKPREHVAGEIFRVQWPQCTHAYVVFKKALPVLLRTQRDIWAPIDLALIFRSFPHLNVYTVLPRIAGQRGQEIAP